MSRFAVIYEDPEYEDWADSVEDDSDWAFDDADTTNPKYRMTKGDVRALSKPGILYDDVAEKPQEDRGYYIGLDRKG